MATTQGLLLPMLDSDGKMVVYGTPSSPGWNTWITSAGDDPGPPIVRGGGMQMVLTWDGSEQAGTTKSVDIQLAEPVQLHDGGLLYDPALWMLEDTVEYAVVLSATATTANAQNQGNCNLVATGFGFNAIVPAAGNGARNVNLSTAVPVPSPTSEGYWDADYNEGTVTPSTSPGSALFNLYDAEFKNAIVRNSFFFNKGGQFSLPAYGVEWVHPSWILRASVTKSGTGACKVVGWMRCFRRNLQV